MKWGSEDIVFGNRRVKKNNCLYREELAHLVHVNLRESELSDE